jgi:hypothetical protein
MPQSLKDFIRRVDTSRGKLNAVKSIQLQSTSLKSEIRQIVEDYFNEIRPSIIKNETQDDRFGKIDREMQNLLPLCHKKGSRTTYKKHLMQIRKLLIEADSNIISTIVKTPRDNSVDLKIIETLDKILPSAALSYRQGIQDLLAESRFSWRGPATDFRESLRETLDHLAPDNEVKSMPGFKQAPDTNGPTMKQKVKYILEKRGLSKSKGETTENAIDAIELSLGSFIRSVYTRSSISTHTPTDKGEVVRVRNLVRAVLSELLEIDI